VLSYTPSRRRLAKRLLVNRPGVDFGLGAGAVTVAVAAHARSDVGADDAVSDPAAGGDAGVEVVAQTGFVGRRPCFRDRRCRAQGIRSAIRAWMTPGDVSGCFRLPCRAGTADVSECGHPQMLALQLSCV
jgi:hypothetical protein